jgi:NodT family efflux transporter outer membrane factor (OMF) lipoprotein
MTVRAFIVAAGLAAVLAGCAGIPRDQRPEVTVPDAWRNSLTAEAGWPSVAWWRAFGSSELVQLIETAELSNRDLAAARFRIAQARANLQVAGASLLPAVDASGSVGRSGSRGSSASSHQVALGVGYELDVWGRNRATRDAAAAALTSSAYARETTRLTVVADTASAYFQILSLNDRIAVAERQLQNTRELLKLLDIQYRAGAISRFELERQLNVVAGQEASIPPLVQQREQTLDALAVLLGAAPQQVRAPEGSLATLSLPALAPGLPSELLTRRPDVRRAEADLLAANANLEAARAALLPSFDLTARAGLQAASLGSFVGLSGFFWSLAAGITAPIFDAGRLSGQRDAVAARRDELIEQYRQAILVSLRDVEDALIALNQLALQEAAQARALDHALAAFRLAELRYRAGAQDFTTVLDAQRSLIGAESSLLPIRAARFAQTVELFKALGGDWSGAAPLVAR